MKPILIIALQSLLSRAEECDPELFKSFPPDALPTSLSGPTATYLGVQPAEIICSGLTTTTTVVWFVCPTCLHYTYVVQADISRKDLS